jgi:hypothetical protein
MTKRFLTRNVRDVAFPCSSFLLLSSVMISHAFPGRVAMCVRQKGQLLLPPALYASARGRSESRWRSVAYTQNNLLVCGSGSGFGAGSGTVRSDELELLLLLLRHFLVFDLRRSISGSGNAPGMVKGRSGLLGETAGSRRWYCIFSAAIEAARAVLVVWIRRARCEWDDDGAR